MPETRALLEQCVEKVAAVAGARDMQLDDTVVTDAMRYVDSLAANATTSLQRDIAEGKPSEIEFWNGSVVRQGRAVNVLTPVKQFIYHSMLPQDCEHEEKSCFSNEPCTCGNRCDKLSAICLAQGANRTGHLRSVR